MDLNIKSKRILVAGGAGFLGSHLCQRLVQRGDDVICLDNMSTGKKANLIDLFGNANFEFLRHDVTFPTYLEVDEIYNLASPASPIHYQLDPVQTTKTNVHGAINLLGLAKRTGAKIFQASTSEVYGDPAVTPQKESYWGNVNPIGIRSCYDEGKRCAETLFFDYHRQHGIDIRVVRIFNTYGPKMYLQDGRVVTNFIMQALNGEAITVYGDGSQSRSFCYVDDMVDAFITFMDLDIDFPGPMNLGNPSEITVLQLASEIIEICESDSEIKFETLPSDDPTNRCPDISLAMEFLNWQPRVGRHEGLQRTVEYFRNIVRTLR